MLVMENAEEVMQILERFTKLKQKDIPKELEDYLSYVAKTGDTVYTWTNIKYLFREKLVHVIKDFHDTTSNIDDLPQYPNVDPFNYETMKSSLLERLDLFSSAPFTIQRLCELLTDPKKQYSRIDKYMRALEKNILVVSTIEPGRKQPESENGDSLDSVVNGDLSLDVNIDVEIDMANEAFFSMQQQLRNNASSSENNTTNTTVSPNNKPTTTEDDTDSSADTKKSKIDVDKSVTTSENKLTVAIPTNQTCNILNEQHKSDNSESSDDSDSQESKEEINKNDSCEVPSIDDGNNQTIIKTDKLEEEKMETKTEDDKSAEKNNLMNPTEDEILEDEKSNSDTLKLTDNNDEPISAEEEDKLLNVDDDLDIKPSVIDSKLEENKSATEKIIKDDVKENLDITLKESAEVETDDNNTKHNEKSDSQKQNQSVDEKFEQISPNDSQITETKTINKENIISKSVETVEVIKIPEKMSVEDVTITAVNVHDIAVSLKEKVSTTAIIADVTVPTEITTQSIPLEVDVQPICHHTEGQIDQPMDDSVTDEIVMQISETEMSTDIELANKLNDKPDLTGMDIDDTSQEEAMDQ